MKHFLKWPSGMSSQSAPAHALIGDDVPRQSVSVDAVKADLYDMSWSGRSSPCQH